MIVDARNAGICLRRARDDDGSAIGQLIAKVFAEYRGCIYDQAEFPELAAIARHFAMIGGAMWVAQVKTPAPGAVIACCAIKPASVAGTYEITKVYVDQPWRGSGLAHRLMALCEDFARMRQAKNLELFSDTRFLAAHRFYRKRGFFQIPGERYLADVSQSWEYHFMRDINAA